MLRTRIITAVVLLPLVVYLVWWAPPWGLALGLAVVVAAGGWEWSQLAGLSNPWVRGAYAVGCAVGTLGLAWYVLGPGVGLLLLTAAAAWWLVPGLRIARFASSGGRQRPLPWLDGLGGVITLLTAAAAMLAVHRFPLGPLWLTVLFLLVWGADIGGYFAGRRWGRRRLAPALSPGKTWAGAAGGLVLGLVAAALALAVATWMGASFAVFWGAGLLLGVVTIAMSVIGDLFESMLKRQRGLKDSGQLLPGHGGILDRIDALVAAAPVFALGLALIGGGADA
ncbi:phosphatidate cytidylyltransferase [Arhodomonas sp. SL1]|uniref:phosphatidate cytidylyltransferase n=1 Tax=Arhodomonas sp. SL1 TaxID=3425691 RepID=UPI003F881A4B